VREFRAERVEARERALQQQQRGRHLERDGFAHFGFVGNHPAREAGQLLGERDEVGIPQVGHPGAQRVARAAERDQALRFVLDGECVPGFLRLFQGILGDAAQDLAQELLRDAGRALGQPAELALDAHAQRRRAAGLPDRLRHQGVEERERGPPERALRREPSRALDLTNDVRMSSAPLASRLSHFSRPHW